MSKTDKIWMVTGGLGFIGSHLCRELIAKGNTVVNIDSRTYAADPNNLEEAYWSDEFVDIVADVRDAIAMEELVGDYKPDYLVHLACCTHVDNSISSPREFVETNVVGTFNMLEAMRKKSPQTKMCCFVTDECYGSIREGQFTEESPFNAASVYSASKVGQDALAGSYHITYGMDVVRLRPANNYGTHQHPEKLIPKFVTELIKGNTVPVYGDGMNVRTWLAVEDCVDATILATLNGKAGSAYNVSSQVEVANIDIAKMLIELTGEYYDKIRYVNDRPGHDFRYSISSDKIRKELGWSPKYDSYDLFAEHMKEVVAWYLDKYSKMH